MHHALALAALLAIAPPWGWPVDPPHIIARPYIAPETPYSAGHRGIDLASPSATVYAPAEGLVHFAGTVVDRPVLSIEHPGGVLSSYEPVVTALVAGDPVVRGQVIGSVLPGHCVSRCLHFGVRVRGEYVSPLLWIGRVEPAVLLPISASARPRSRATDHLYPRNPVGERSPLHLRRVVRRS
ncbi:MAG: family metallopeptidase [Rhodoglobus sp.]|nr:family metallopeptidase [Rhodoglobus sp.]